MKDVAEDPRTEYITSRFMVVSYTTRYYNSGTTGYQAFFFFFSCSFQICDTTCTILQLECIKEWVFFSFSAGWIMLLKITYQCSDTQLAAVRARRREGIF